MTTPLRSAYVEVLVDSLGRMLELRPDVPSERAEAADEVLRTMLDELHSEEYRAIALRYARRFAALAKMIETGRLS